MSLIGESAPKSPFRQAALARLNNPEQLDRLLTVTGARSWIAFIVFLGLIAAAIGWSVMGTLSTYVTGRGLFLNEGGRVVAAAAAGAGRLVELGVAQGDLVRKGQVVARLLSPEAQAQLVSATELVKERENELARQRTFSAAELGEKRAGFAKRRSALRNQQQAARVRAASLQVLLGDQERLLHDKVVTRSAVLQTRAQLDQALQEASDSDAQISALDNQELDAAFQSEQRVKNSEFSLAEARRQHAELVKADHSATEVVAPADGRVEAIDVNLGSLITRGQPILTLETPGEHLEVVLFVSIRDGDLVVRGQRVNISPNGTSREEDGTVIGTIRDITRFPVTPEGIRSLVHNEDLVRSFSSQGPTFLAYVELQRDPKTASGYAWTSLKGAAELLASGSFANADVLVKQQRPIGFVIPTLRRWTGF
ncbi:MAG TPA: NHLP bacteriocin system secretion protein [Stellaceae bacterium]|nr:NHLP bacteriocin system secretion protein [Stellaceae bacterium]